MDLITITPITASDIDTIIPLAHRIWHAHYPAIITVEQIEYMLQHGYTAEVITDEIEHKGIIWLAIRDNNAMIGFASVGPHGDGILKLHKLYVLPEYHGKGIGARALAKIEDIAKAEKAIKLVLNVNKYNSKAIRAYERAGWRVAESVVQDIGNGFVMDDFVMEKLLE